MSRIMPSKRAKLGTGGVQPSLVEYSGSSFGSFFFWLVILALCAGGYWYYQHMETKNEEHRSKRAIQAAQNARIREENAAARERAPQTSPSPYTRTPSASPAKPKHSYGPQDGSGMGSVNPL